jgi:hypothetical protein
MKKQKYSQMSVNVDRLCDLVAKSSWLQIQRAGFDFLRYQIY